MTEDSDFLLSSYNYNLPQESIAQSPPIQAGSSRLMVLAGNNPPFHSEFSRIFDFLPKNALIVANNSRVLPARLLSSRSNGGKFEFLLLTPLPLILASASKQGIFWTADIECLLKPASKFAPGDMLKLAPNLDGEILTKGEYGQHQLRIRWPVDIKLEDIFNSFGLLPLPPYIKRSPDVSDKLRYQTVYASATGSVAAPTAGLHFTSQIRSDLIEHGCDWTEITLHVGYGTFSPVRQDDIKKHKMHPEFVEISETASQKINQAREEHRPIVAVGTTTIRTLEGVMHTEREIKPFRGWINIFIYPGFEFKIANAMLTNFHLPQSTLLMLVSAFAGRKKILAAYAEAVAKNYRFFSYGDAMLIKK